MYNLDVRKLNLTQPTTTMGTLFKMEGLICAYENYRDITGFLPVSIFMTQEQHDSYRQQLDDMASLLGIDGRGAGNLFFRGVKVEIKKL